MIFLINSLWKVVYLVIHVSHEERLGGGSRCGSCGGAEVSNHLQMQPHNEIYSSKCQEQPKMVNGLRKLKFQIHVMRNLSKNLYIFFHSF